MRIVIPACLLQQGDDEFSAGIGLGGQNELRQVLQLPPHSATIRVESATRHSLRVQMTAQRRLPK
jgi:hypothetical protein